MLTACALCGTHTGMDYEALGRHTDAVERAQKIANEFCQRMKQFSDDLKRIDTDRLSSMSHVPELDAAEVRAHLDAVTSLHGSILELAREANIQGAKCGKSAIMIGRGPNAHPA